MALSLLTLRALASAAALVLALSVTGTAAAQSIGTAAVVRNDVSRVRGGQASDLPTGGSVSLQDAVRTGAASSARLVFLDSSNLAVGPSSQITLDRSVYSGGAPASGKNVLNLASGAFRFVSGATTKATTEIRTEVASIGIRGTEFDVLSEAGRTTVTLRRGEVSLCTLSAPRSCVILKPGQTGVVEIGSPARRSGSPFSFAGFCSADPALCGTGRIRLAGPPPDTLSSPGLPTGALCGR